MNFLKFVENTNSETICHVFMQKSLAVIWCQICFSHSFHLHRRRIGKLLNGVNMFQKVISVRAKFRSAHVNWSNGQFGHLRFWKRLKLITYEKRIINEQGERKIVLNGAHAVIHKDSVIKQLICPTNSPKFMFADGLFRVYPCEKWKSYFVLKRTLVRRIHSITSKEKTSSSLLIWGATPALNRRWRWEARRKPGFEHSVSYFSEVRDNR